MQEPVSGEILWALLIEILVVLPSPTGYMLSSFGSSLLDWDVLFKLLLK